MNVSGVTARLTPQMVTQGAVQAVGNDGDGLSGAALNDGDAAAHAAANQRISPATPAAAAAPTGLARGHVDVKVS